MSVLVAEITTRVLLALVNVSLAFLAGWWLCERTMGRAIVAQSLPSQAETEPVL